MRNQIDSGKVRGPIDGLDKFISDSDTKSAVKDFLGMKNQATKEAIDVGNAFKTLVDSFVSVDNLEKDTEIDKGKSKKKDNVKWSSGTIVGHLTEEL